MTDQDIVSKIPAVDFLLRHDRIKPYIDSYGSRLVKYFVRKVLDSLRAEVRSGQKLISREEIVSKIIRSIEDLIQPSLKPVVNATGILLHTNLGRAPLGSYLISEIEKIAQGYSNLEFDLKKARRGHRNDHLTGLLAYITGAESALAVNNNAAAVMLILKTFACRKEVLISRGELIEIGGSFRIPDIMKASGAKMIEVGTTNRTRLADYREAITSRTRIILKAHKSNYQISGFTEEVPIEELAELAQEHGLIMVFDMGSGLLRKPPGLPLEEEPDVESALSSGVDIVSFSGDKLLGGPQAGIIAGKENYIMKLAKAPMMRALRVGKLTMAALTAAVRAYLTDRTLSAKIPVFSQLQRSPAEILQLARKLAAGLKEVGFDNEIVDSPARIGGGSLPELKLPSKAVKLLPLSGQRNRAKKIYRDLLELPVPILGALREGKLVFDVFALTPEDIDLIIQEFREMSEQ